MIEWKESTIDGEAYIEAEYRGMGLVISKEGEKWNGYVHNQTKHINCGRSSDIELMKEKLVHIADNEVEVFTGRWHPYPEEKPTEEGKYLVSFHYDAIGDNVDTDHWDGEEWRDFGSMVYAWSHRPKSAWRYNAQES